MRRDALGLVAAVVMVLASPALADGPYLEPTEFMPEGVTFGIGSYGGAFAATSCCDIGGERGASAVQLRWGAAATERLLFVLQIDGGNVLVERNDGDLVLNQVGSLTLNGQYYVADAVWAKAGLGFAGYTIRDDEDREEANLQRGGFALLGAVGYDVVQTRDVWFFGIPRQDFALSLELLIIGSIYPASENEVMPNEQLDRGGILQVTLGLGAQWY